MTARTAVMSSSTRLTGSVRPTGLMGLMLLAGLAAALALRPAHAAGPFDGAELYLKGGTLGAGIGVATSITGTPFGLRLAYDGGGLGHSGSYASNPYSARLKFSSFELLADAYVVGGLRLTLGGIQSSNKLELTATGLANGYTLNGVVYPVSSAMAEVDLGGGKFNPYAGFGYSSRPSGHAGLGFHFDAGVMPQKPTSSITVGAPSVILNDPTFQSNKAIEEQKLQDSVSNAKNWPVVSIGLSYAF